jgi:hypothetical protein
MTNKTKRALELVEDLETLMNETERVELSECSEETIVRIEAMMYTMRLCTRMVGELKALLSEQEGRSYDDLSGKVSKLSDLYYKDRDDMPSYAIASPEDCVDAIMHNIVEDRKGLEVERLGSRHGKCPYCSRIVAPHSSPEKCSGCGKNIIWPNTDEQGEGKEEAKRTDIFVSRGINDLKKGFGIKVCLACMASPCECSAKKVGG